MPKHYKNDVRMFPKCQRIKNFFIVDNGLITRPPPPMGGGGGDSNRYWGSSLRGRPLTRWYDPPPPPGWGGVTFPTWSQPPPSGTVQKKIFSQISDYNVSNRSLITSRMFLGPGKVLESIYSNTVLSLETCSL